MSKTFGKTKTFAVIVLAVITVFAVAAYKISGVHITANQEDEMHAVQLVSEHTTQVAFGEPSVQFIGHCTDMNMSVPGVYLVGVSECLGRIRGFVEGHNTTVAMVRAVAKVNGLELWCMNESVDSEQLLTTVMDWVDANPARYAGIVARNEVSNVAPIAIVSALREAYPCVNS